MRKFEKGYVKECIEDIYIKTRTIYLFYPIRCVQKDNCKKSESYGTSMKYSYT